MATVAGKRKRKRRPTAVQHVTAPTTAASSDPRAAPALRIDVQRERRLGLVAGAAAIASVLLTLGAVPVAATGPRIVAPAGSDQALLLRVAASGSAQVAAMWMRVAGTLLLALVAWYLYRVTRARNQAHRREIPILGLCAFGLVAVSTAVGFFEVRHVAHEFVFAGPRTAARAHQLLASQRDRGPLRAADIGRLVGAVGFGIWVSLASHEATSVGLLTRFLGIFGVGAGLTTAIGFPVAPALFMGWLGSVGALAAGYWPGGRPPAWDLGRALPWDEVDESPARPVRT